MKKNMFDYLQEVLGCNLQYLPWANTVVPSYILPKLAREPEYRNRIGDEFMRFMAEYYQEVYNQDQKLGNVLLEIAMQRVSNGAVLHREDPTPTFDALPLEYHKYASANGFVGGEPGLMGEPVYGFIIKALPFCVLQKQLQKHALAIYFGLMHNLSVDGQEENGYMLGTMNFKPDGVLLFNQAKAKAEAFASDEELWRHYAQPDQWKKHLDWFHQLHKDGALNWSRFFEATNADEGKRGGVFSRFLRRRKIKKLIQNFGTSTVS